MARPASRGAAADLHKAAEEQKQAELELRRLECQVSQLAHATAINDCTEQRLNAARKRRDEVRASKKQAEEYRLEREEAAHEAARRAKEREAARRSQARQAMLAVFVDKRAEVQDLKKRWGQSASACRDQTRDEEEQLRTATIEERRAQARRKHDVVASIQQERAEAREKRRLQRLEAKAIAEQRDADVTDHLADQVRQSRSHARVAIQKARDELVAKHQAERVSMVERLRGIRTQEVGRIHAEMARLEEVKRSLEASARRSR